MFRFEQLEIWKRSIEYIDVCYDVAHALPIEERYGLSDQLRRAAVSIANNIAEGSTGSALNFSHYLEISLGSTFETVSILYVMEKRKFISPEKRIQMYEQAEHLVRSIRSFKKSLYETKTE